MFGSRQIGWIAAGWLLAGFAYPLTGPDVAHAQAVTSDRFITRIKPAVPPQRPVPPLLPEDGDSVMRLRGGIYPEPPGDPADPSTEDRPGLVITRPAVADVSGIVAAEPPVDGIIEDGDVAHTTPSTDDGTVDTRSTDDYNAFESPPAGFDPDAFAIEVSPILDRRPERLARFEPYEATGIRVGSFIAFPEAELDIGAFSNVFHSTTLPRRDTAFEVRPSLRVTSNWRVHALEFRAKGMASFHEEYATEDDRAYTLEARGRVDFGRRTNVETLIASELSRDARGDISAPTSARERGDIATRRAALSFNHRFNRLTVQLRGSIVDTDYAAVETVSGERISNAERDVTIYETAMRLQWEFRPTLLAFAELSHNVRQHIAAPSDGILRDSAGERARIGLSFGNTGRILRGELSVGYGRQRPDDSRLAEIDGIIVDANIGYRWSALTSVLLTARSEIGEATLPGVSGAMARSAGIEVRHALRRNLFAIAGTTSTWQDYDGISLEEREFVGTLATEYFVNREVALFARFQHIQFTSTDPMRGYDADEIRVGMRIRR